MNKSKELWEESQKYIPGGVNSPVRAFRSVGLDPIFIDKGSGSKIYDVDENEYIDYVLSWGPMILGHAHPQVIQAVKSAIDKGTSFGAPTELELTLAKMITSAYPSIELLRLVSSGTEAAMTAIRLARGFTKRDKIIKFEKLCQAVNEAEDILSDTKVSIDVSGHNVKVPFRLLLTRLNTQLDLDIKGKQIKIKFRTMPLESEVNDFSQVGDAKAVSG